MYCLKLPLLKRKTYQSAKTCMDIDVHEHGQLVRKTVMK